MTARIDLAHCQFSFMEQKKIFRPNWCSPEGNINTKEVCVFLVSFAVLSHRYEDQNRKASDMYSFAIMLWELATMQIPFGDAPVMAVGLKVCYLLLVVVNRPVVSRLQRNTGDHSYHKELIITLVVSLKSAGMQML